MLNVGTKVYYLYDPTVGRPGYEKQIGHVAGYGDNGSYLVAGDVTEGNAVEIPAGWVWPKMVGDKVVSLHSEYGHPLGSDRHTIYLDGQCVGAAAMVEDANKIAAFLAEYHDALGWALGIVDALGPGEVGFSGNPS